MSQKQIVLLCLLLFGAIAAANAQRMVTGRVTDSNDGQPIPMVSVIVKGTNVGVISGSDGAYSVDVPDGSDVLVFSFIGYSTREETIGARTVVNVSLEEATHELDDIIVVAYGTAKKSSFTGSAVQVSGEEISRKNQSEITKALAGEVAGLQVVNTNGQPGANATIRIRGYGSVNSSRTPLYVLDGVPFDGDISAIDLADVESTTVLKDASAAALYGARAANGVIIVTTKKGNKGKTSIEADVKYGINVRVIPLYDVIDSPERYVELSWEALRNYGILQDKLSPYAAGIYASNNLFDKTRGIPAVYNMWNTSGNSVVDPVTGRFTGATRKYSPEKWADHMFRTGQKREASLRFSGGSDQLSYYTSFGGVDEKGYYIGSDFSRLNVRTNLNYSPRTWLKATTNLSYSYMNLNNPSQTDNQNNGFQFVNNMPPLYPVFQRDEAGRLVPDPLVGGNRYDFGMGPGYERGYASGINPAGTINLDKEKAVTHQLSGNANFEITFLKDFKFSSSNGYQYLKIEATGLTNPYYGDAKGIGRIERSHDSYLSMTNTQMLSYSKKISNHSLSAFAAHESSYLLISQDYAYKSKMAKPDNTEFNNAIIMQSIAGYKLDRSIESYFAQVKYDYDEKYFADVNFRRDASSRFKNHKWGNFGSGGVAWAINKEEFMSRLDFVNHLRFKASFGTYGNESLNLGSSNANYYPTQTLYSIRNLNDEISYTLYYLGNSDLTWENSNMFNTGIDFGLWDDRLSGEIEFFRKTTTNMIFSKQVATSLGYASAPVNDAELLNTGVEFTLKGTVVKTSDWEVELFANGSHYRNKMLKMPMEGAKEKNFELKSPYGWSKDHSIYDFYMRDYAGVDPATGMSQWYVYYDKKNLTDVEPTRIANMNDYLAQRAAAGEAVDIDEQTTTKYADATLKYTGKSAIPDLSGGFGFNVKYKGVELSSMFVYSVGGYGYDYVYAALMGNAAVGTMNWHKDIEQRWTAPGQNTVVPRLSATYDTNVTSLSSRFLTKRDYLGLNNVRLAYTFPKKLTEKISVLKATVWLSGDNLYLTTSRHGYFPVGHEAGESARSQYIPLTTFMGGINIQF